MFSAKLKKLMTEQKVSQTQLSKMTGIGKPSISQYLAGKNLPGSGNLEKFAEALGCPVEHLKTDIPKSFESIPNVVPDRNLTVHEVAARIGKAPQFVYSTLQTGTCPFGFGIKGRGNRWTYFIPAQRFENYLRGGDATCQG